MIGGGVISPTPIRAFLSYARADDAEFHFVEPLVNKLKALVIAKSGRELDVFIDRETIGWGDDWRARLSQSVEAATIFIPLVTANYLSRPHCREEFLAFYNKANTVGATDLILPILPLRTSLVDPYKDEIAHAVERRQYRLLEDPMLSGYESAAWLTAMAALATDLLDSLERAEQRLMHIRSINTTSPDGIDKEVITDEEAPDSEGPGLLELNAVAEFRR
jgi:hypothetical protein